MGKYADKCNEGTYRFKNLNYFARRWVGNLYVYCFAIGKFYCYNKIFSGQPQVLIPSDNYNYAEDFHQGLARHTQSPSKDFLVTTICLTPFRQ